MAELSFIGQYNELLTSIGKSTSVEEMRTLFSSIKKFYTLYHEVDRESVERVYDKYAKKLRELIEESEFVYKRMQNKAEEINNSTYDFSSEADDSNAVQNKVRQLMSQLPKAKTLANATAISKAIESTIQSGVVGCKAVLELMKYQVYADMINERQKQSAYEGSKTAEQKAFERLNQASMDSVTKVLASTQLQGFHLRNLEKQVNSFRKTSFWQE